MLVSRTDPFDDSISRDALSRFCTQYNWELTLNDKYARVDAVVCTDKGKLRAIELACNACWTTQEEYPQDIHIPTRKFQYFREVIHPPENLNLTAVEEGYFIVFNVPHTKAAVLKFTMLIDGFFDTAIMSLNGEQCEVVLVSKTYIYRYIEIPA